MKKNILLVNNQKTHNEIISSTLRKAGFDVLMARTADEAMDYVNCCKIDLVITDYQIPETDGVELIKTFRSREINLKAPAILLCSGNLKINLSEIKKIGISEIVKNKMDTGLIEKKARKVLYPWKFWTNYFMFSLQVF